MVTSAAEAHNIPLLIESSTALARLFVPTVKTLMVAQEICGLAAGQSHGRNT